MSDPESREQQAEIESLLIDFDLEWSPDALQDFVPRLESYPSDIRRSALQQAIVVDLERSWERGHRRFVEHYLTQYTELRAGSRMPVALVRAEALARHRVGDVITVDELAGRFRVPREQLQRFIDKTFEDAQDTHRSAPEIGTLGVQARDDTAGSRRGVRTRCPFCNAHVRIREGQELSAIDCSECGRQFSLVNDEQPVHRTDGIECLGHFELIEPAGSGSFGTVWKARDTQLDRIVALKIPRIQKMDAATAELFFREARAIAQLRHPNIVGVYEIGRDGDTLFIVSEFIDGVSLQEWLEQNSLSFSEAVELCVKIADALTHAHEKEIIHRDLKPGNIMLDVDGQPHITDFGLARRLSGEITVTAEGQILGTPAYMSPEQAKGEGHSAGPASDQYSLGVMLYEMLGEKLPFRGPLHAVLQKIVAEDAPSLRSFNNSIPAELEAVCRKAMLKEPADRYESVSAMRADLARWMRGESVSVRPIGRSQQMVRWVRRNALLSGLMTALVVLLVLLGIVASRQSTPPAPAAEQLAIVPEPGPADDSGIPPAVPEPESTPLDALLQQKGNLEFNLDKHDQALSRKQFLSAFASAIEQSTISEEERRVCGPQLGRLMVAVASLVDVNPEVVVGPDGRVDHAPLTIRGITLRNADALGGLIRIVIDGEAYAEISEAHGATAGSMSRRLIDDLQSGIHRFTGGTASVPGLLRPETSDQSVWSSGRIQGTEYRITADQDEGDAINSFGLIERRRIPWTRFAIECDWKPPIEVSAATPAFDGAWVDAVLDETANVQAVRARRQNSIHYRLEPARRNRAPKWLPVENLAASFHRALLGGRVATNAPQGRAPMEMSEELSNYGGFLDKDYAVPVFDPVHRGAKFVAVRGIVDVADQLDEVADALSYSTPPETVYRLVRYLGFELERQTALDRNRWSDWHACDQESTAAVCRKWFASPDPPGGRPAGRTQHPPMTTAQRLQIDGDTPWSIDPQLTMPLPSILIGPPDELLSLEQIPAVLPRGQQLLWNDLTTLMSDPAGQTVNPAAADPGQTVFPPFTDSVRSRIRNVLMTDEPDTLISRVKARIGNIDETGVRQELADLLRTPVLFRYLDFDIEPGRSYRYRVRLRVTNPVADLPADAFGDADELQRQKTVVTEWSEATDRATILGDTATFLDSVSRSVRAGSDGFDRSASLSAFRWHADTGTVVRVGLSVRPGQFIAGKSPTEVFHPGDARMVSNRPARRRRPELVFGGSDDLHLSVSSKWEVEVRTRDLVLDVIGRPDLEADGHSDLLLPGARSARPQHPDERILALAPSGEIRPIRARSRMKDRSRLEQIRARQLQRGSILGRIAYKAETSSEEQMRAAWQAKLDTVLFKLETRDEVPFPFPIASSEVLPVMRLEKPLPIGQSTHQLRTDRLRMTRLRDLSAKADSDFVSRVAKRMILSFAASEYRDHPESPRMDVVNAHDAILEKPVRRRFVNEMLPEIPQLFENRFDVRLNAAILLGQLNRAAEVGKSSSIEFRGYPEAVPLLQNVVASPEQLDSLKYAAVKSLSRVVRSLDPALSRASSLKAVLLDEMQRRDANEWYQAKAAALIGLLSQRLPADEVAPVEKVLFGILKDEQRRLRVRSACARTLGGLSGRGRTSSQTDDYARSTASLAYEIAEAFNNQPDNFDYADYLFDVYAAFHGVGHERKQGFLSSSDSPVVRDAYQRVLPAVRVAVSDRKSQKWISGPQLAALRDWLKEQGAAPAPRDVN